MAARLALNDAVNHHFVPFNRKYRAAPLPFISNCPVALSAFDSVA